MASKKKIVNLNQDSSKRKPREEGAMKPFQGIYSPDSIRTWKEGCKGKKELSRVRRKMLENVEWEE